MSKKKNNFCCQLRELNKSPALPTSQIQFDGLWTNWDQILILEIAEVFFVFRPFLLSVFQSTWFMNLTLYRTFNVSFKFIWFESNKNSPRLVCP